MQKIMKNIAFTPIERLLIALGMLLGIIVVGTLGFIIIGGRSLIDAVYMALITISTLGMQSSTITPAEQIWIIFLIAVGIALAMIALSLIVGMVVEGQMRIILGRRKVNMKIASLGSHIIVCGYGRMGRSVCGNLKQRKTDVVVIDQDDHKTAQAESDHVLYILGDASEESVLRDAGIERARGLVTVLDNDAANVFVTLIARDLNPEKTTRQTERLNHSIVNPTLNRKSVYPTILGHLADTEYTFGAFVVADDQGEVVLIRRTPIKQHAGIENSWWVPGGARENGETLDETAIREFRALLRKVGLER